MSNLSAAPIYDDLLASTGRFVFYWSSFELALTKAIGEKRSRLGLQSDMVRGVLKDRLRIWAELVAQLPESAEKSDIAAKVCNQALSLQKVRNQIIHGLVNVDARSDQPEPPHIRCAVGGFEAPTGQHVIYTMEDLEHFTQGVDACRRAMDTLFAFDDSIHP